jgi:uncharacterized protein
MHRSLPVIFPTKQVACASASCCSEKRSENNFTVTILLIAICCLLPNLALFPSAPASSVLSDFLIFSLGLTTGFHCIGMCGGFVFYGFEQYSPRRKLWSSLAYIVTKTCSYTILGAIAGLVGQTLAFTPGLRAMIAAVSGGLLITGVLLKYLAKPNWHLLAKVDDQTSWRAPLLGLLNGFMIACGPLQAMYLLAAGTASAVAGAKVLLLFALGTIPVMFGLITLINFTKHKFDLSKVAPIVTLYFGLTMLVSGLNLWGIDYKNLLPFSITSNAYTVSDAGNKIQTIKMQALQHHWYPNAFVLKKGVPVRWVIDSKKMSHCTKSITIKDLNLDIPLNGEQQVVEFVPSQSGTINWSCWMGMAPGKFVVEP